MISNKIKKAAGSKAQTVINRNSKAAAINKPSPLVAVVSATQPSELVADNSIMQLVAAAKQLSDDCRAMTVDAEAKILARLQEQLPVGLIITINAAATHDICPTYLLNVKTLHGDDRGAERFRIDKIRHVELRMDQPHLSRWDCDATPIIENTGKCVHGSSKKCHPSNQPVVLRGYVGCLG